MTNRSETEITQALQRTMGLLPAEEVLRGPVNLDDAVLVFQQDIDTLRDVTLAHIESENWPVVSHPLNVLNSKYAEYGEGANRIRIERSLYDSLLAPQRLTATLRRERY